MRTYAKLATTTLIATVALTALVSTAGAGRLSTSNQNIRVVWSAVEFVGAVTIRCRVTLEGSFHYRSILKVPGSLVGLVTRAISDNANCTNGRSWIFNGTERRGAATLANTLPWHLTYEGFGGTLPNITQARLLVVGARFLVEALFQRCIYTSTAAENVTGTATLTAGVIDRLRASGEVRPEAGSSGSCPNPGRFSSRAEDGVITVLNVATRITITLI